MRHRPLTATVDGFGHAKVLLWVCLLSLLLLAAMAMGQDHRPGELIVAVRPGGDIRVLALLYGLDPSRLERLEGTNIWRVRALGDLLVTLARLRRDRNVEFAELNSILATPEAEQQSMAFVDQNQPPYIEGESPGQYFDQLDSKIMAGQAHALTTGRGVVVAVVDTGTSFEHPALEARTLAGWDFVDNDPDPTDEPGGLGYGHGTFVSGIVSLVAPDAWVLPLRALDSAGRGDIFTVARAILYGVNQGASVINLSLGLSRRALVVDVSIKYAADREVVVVASAGNRNSSDPQYPAASPHVMGVAAVDDDDIKADFSNFNERLSVSAPGVDVYSTFPSDRFASWSGTSFSAAFVSGEVALVRALTQAGATDIVEIIKQSSEDIYPLNPDYVGGLGSGRINCMMAVSR